MSNQSVFNRGTMIVLSYVPKRARPATLAFAKVAGLARVAFELIHAKVQEQVGGDNRRGQLLGHLLVQEGEGSVRVNSVPLT